MERTYVKRVGRMTNAQKKAYETLFPLHGLPFTGETIDFQEIFGNDNPVIIEIGFGMGIATATIAEANPQINYLGMEVHTPGIGRLLMEIESRHLQNIRIMEHDAVEVLDKVRDAAVAGFHLFFPDPWPKKRHHKRRIIQKPFTDTVAAKLKTGGYVYMATDWVEYGDWALAELSATKGLANAYTGFAPPQQWRPKTKFEQKGLQKQHEIRELYFIATR